MDAAPESSSSATAPPAPSRADDPGAPRCALQGDLASFMQAYGSDQDDGGAGDAGAWETRVRSRLLDGDRAEELVGPAAWRALDALATHRYDALASMLGSEGLCLRAAKGAQCVRLTIEQVRRCATLPTKWDVPLDSGKEGPFFMTCSQAMAAVFFSPDLRRPTAITYNCFPGGRGNNASPIVLRPAKAFVEFFVQPRNMPSHSLWFVFDAAATTASRDASASACSELQPCDDDGRRLYLVELIAEYWGI
jgi:hypothetical protein